MRFLRRRATVEMTVRADAVRKGDLIFPKDRTADPAVRRRVTEITKYSSPAGEVSSVYLLVASRAYRFNSIYLPDERISIQRRVR